MLRQHVYGYATAATRERLGGRYQRPACATGNVILDGPVVLGIAATGRWPDFLRLIPAPTFVSQNTPAEIREAWVEGVSGAEVVNLDGLVVLPVADPADAAQAIQRGREWRALGETWRPTGMSAVRANALAASVVTAIERGIRLVSHDPLAWNLVYRRHRARKLSLLGLADILTSAAREGRITAVEAWAAYCEITASEAGQQPDWPVSTSEMAFMALANQAGSGVIQKPASS